MSKSNKVLYVPETPAGTELWLLKANTEEKAWSNLMKDAAHMPYKTKDDFVKRGYKVEQWELA